MRPPAVAQVQPEGKEEVLQLPEPEHDWPSVVVVPAAAALVVDEGEAVVGVRDGANVGAIVGAGVPHAKV